MKKIKISIIYVYYNTPLELLKSIESLPKAVGKVSYEIIIVDNGSFKKLPKEIKLKSKNLTIVNNGKNNGYGVGLNMGERIAKGEFLVLVNPDTEFGDKSIQYAIEKISKDYKIGVIGPQMRSKENKILPTISGKPTIPNVLFAFSFLQKVWKNNPYSQKYWLFHLDRNIQQEVDVVSGACMILKKSVFEGVNGFDPRFFMYFEEVDLCMRIKQLGYKVIYFPKSKIIHHIGKSLENNDKVQEMFEKSRFLFLKKYHGLFSALFAEAFLRITSVQYFFLCLILLISAFINLYKINSLILFFGDIGRDYLAARDMILTGNIPLVGIPSSVVWLHQGPLSIYIIGLGLLFGKFNPIVPAILYGLVGVASTFFVYLTGKTFFNFRIGLLAALFYATSPLVVVNTRMPYHTSSIPLFASIFFLLVYKVLNGNKKLLFRTFFVLGLLLQVELSNVVLFFVMAVSFFIYQIKIYKSDVIKSVLGFTLGILPFIIYDLTHGFIQTLGLPLWTINRIRLFFGLTFSGNSTTIHYQDAIYRIYQQVASTIFPFSLIITFFVFILIASVLVYKRKLLIEKNLQLILVLFWLVIPLAGFIIHTSPGTAYFPLLFPAISLMIAYAVFQIYLKLKYIIVFFVLGCIFNVVFILNNEYFLVTSKALHTLPPMSYNLGFAFSLEEETCRFIVKDAKGQPFTLSGGGFIKTLVTGIDNYTYIIWYLGGKITKNADLNYTIYEDKTMIPKNSKIAYNNSYIYVIKDEKK